jgi:hypothetical protein
MSDEEKHDHEVAMLQKIDFKSLIQLVILVITLCGSIATAGIAYHRLGKVEAVAIANKSILDKHTEVLAAPRFTSEHFVSGLKENNTIRDNTLAVMRKDIDRLEQNLNSQSLLIGDVRQVMTKNSTILSALSDMVKEIRTELKEGE